MSWCVGSVSRAGQAGVREGAGAGAVPPDGDGGLSPEAFIWRGRLYVVRAVLSQWRERRPGGATPSTPTRRRCGPARRSSRPRASSTSGGSRPARAGPSPPASTTSPTTSRRGRRPVVARPGRRLTAAHARHPTRRPPATGDSPPVTASTPPILSHPPTARRRRHHRDRRPPAPPTHLGRRARPARPSPRDPRVRLPHGETSERYRDAHLGALRAAAALIAARTVPTPRSRPRSVWQVLPGVAPELGEWAAFFAACSAHRSVIDRGGHLSAREADDLLRQSEMFLEIVQDLLGVPLTVPLPQSIPPVSSRSTGDGPDTASGSAVGVRHHAVGASPRRRRPGRPLRAAASRRDASCTCTSPRATRCATAPPSPTSSSSGPPPSVSPPSR